MLLSKTAHSILTVLLESSLTVGTNLSLCNFHPQVLILSLGTTQKKPNPSSTFHMSALQAFEDSHQVSHDCCGRLNTVSPKDVYVLIPRTYQSLIRQRDLADITKLKILRWRDKPELSW